MNQYKMLWVDELAPKINAWWQTKTIEEKANIESAGAIIAPTIGTLLGCIFVLLAF